MALIGLKQSLRNRRGAVMILVVGMIVGLVILTAVVIDVGYLSMTKTQLQAAADSSALAGGMELYKGLGVAPLLTPGQAQAAASSVAVDFASRNRAGDRSSVLVDVGRDVRFGNARFVGGAWQMSWGAQPYNMIGVSALRNQAGSGTGDGPVPLFFSGFMGATANLSVTASAALMPGSTFKIPPGTTLTASTLPLSMDEESWNLLMGGTGPDAFSYNPNNNKVTNGSDGIREADLYPHTDVTLPNAGNRGTIDLGNQNNSTSELERQIVNGLNAQDLSYFPNGELTASPSQTLVVTGDTGLSAGLKSALTSIIGQARSVALFRQVTGSGNNAEFTIVKFVGIRIVDVQLTGNSKHVWIQPATVVDPTVVGDITATVKSDSIFAPIMLIQ